MTKLNIAMSVLVMISTHAFIYKLGQLHGVQEAQAIHEDALMPVVMNRILENHKDLRSGGGSKGN